MFNSGIFNNPIESPADDPSLVIRAQNVYVRYKLYHFKVTTLKEWVVRKFNRSQKIETFEALHNVNIEGRKGESIALMGHNGSGKSTLLKVLAGIIEPPGALVQMYGRIAPMIELGAGFDGELSGRENIYLSCMLMGLDRIEVKERVHQIIEFSELGNFIDMPLKNYSSGMYARLGFACATAVNPDILLADEILAVGDANFAAKCLSRIEELRANGTTVIFVSHSSATVKQFCTRGYVLSHGRVIFAGNIHDCIQAHEKSMREIAEQGSLSAGRG